MTLDTFFEKLALFADAPDAVAKMRELVLQLAVQGKLTQQLGSDDSVEKLLEKIHAEKVSLANEGVLKKAERVEALQDNFELPSQWRRVPLAALCISVTDGDHLPPPKADTGVPFLVISDVRWGGIDFTGCRRVSDEYFAKLDWIRKPQERDILYTLVGSFGIPVVVRDSQPFCVQRHIGILRPSKHLELQYLAYALESKLVFRQAALVATGIAQKTVPLAGLRKIIVPLPPLAEQKRIVAKVDELMALCDRLEAQQQEREAKASHLARASLARFADAPTPANLDYLFHSSFSIPPSDLRKSILTLAVQGKLVPQDPNDEPVEELLKKIEAEKKRLADKGELKADKKTWVNSSPNPPHEIPESWSWVRLQDIFEISRGGSPRPAGDPRFFGGPIPWITVGEVTKDTGKYLTHTATGLTEQGSERSRFIDPGDLLLTNSGATLGVPKISKIRGCMNDGVAVLRLFHSYDLNDFGYLYLTHQTPAFRNVNQGMGQPNLNTPIIAGWFFPLPPLAEQRRIVAKVEQLMALVDALETQLAASRTTAANLLSALVAELTQPT